MAVGGDVRRHSWIIKIIKLILCLMYKCKYFYRRVSVGKFIDIFFVMADNTDTEVFGEKEGVIAFNPYLLVNKFLFPVTSTPSLGILMRKVGMANTTVLKVPSHQLRIA